MMRMLILVAVVAIAACGYEPPAQADRSSPAYRADVTACENSVPAEVNVRNAKTGLAWFTSPVRRWGQISDGVRTCMAGQGYGSLRWCTDDEIRQGSRSGNLVVTASGLQCTDPPDPRRRKAG